MRKIEEFFEKYNYIFLAAMVFLFVHSRYKYLGEISYYMHRDELESAYQALCLSHFGPVPGTGIHLLVYLGAIIMKLKGGLFSLKLFRLISVAAGLFGMIFSYLFTLQITGQKKHAFLEALLVTVLPVFFISQRAGVEDWYFLYIIPAAFFFLLKGIGSEKIYLLVLSGLFFAAALFTNGIAVYTVPVFLIAVSVYLIMLQKAGIRQILALMSLPVAGTVVKLIAEGMRFELHLTGFIPNLMNIKALVWDDSHPFNISSTFGTIYIFSVPVVLVGIFLSVGKVIRAFKSRKYDVDVILWIFALTVTVFTLMTDNADTQTSCAVFFVVSILITEGLAYISDSLKGSYIIVIAAYLISFWAFTHYYYENFNSEVNNSADHEEGIVVDKSIGEAVKTSLKMLPDKDISIISDDFASRNLMIALFGDVSYDEYSRFKDDDSFTSGKIRVNADNEFDTSGNSVYIINQAEHQDIIDNLTAQGWGNLYLKEYTVCFMH